VKHPVRSRTSLAGGLPMRSPAVPRYRAGHGVRVGLPERGPSVGHRAGPASDRAAGRGRAHRRRRDRRRLWHRRELPLSGVTRPRGRRGGRGTDGDRSRAGEGSAARQQLHIRRR
jgi:hypothetical protein